jgi:hypothetical protein
MLTLSPPPPAVVVGIVRDEQIGIKRVKGMRAQHPDAPPPALVIAVVLVVVVRVLLLQPEALRHNPNILDIREAPEEHKQAQASREKGRLTMVCPLPGTDSPVELRGEYK